MMKYLDRYGKPLSAGMQRVLKLIKDNPGITKPELILRLNINNSSLRSSVSRLITHKCIIAKITDGCKIKQRLYVNPDYDPKIHSIHKKETKHPSHFNQKILDLLKDKQMNTAQIAHALGVDRPSATALCGRLLSKKVIISHGGIPCVYSKAPDKEDAELLSVKSMEMTKNGVIVQHIAPGHRRYDCSRLHIANDTIGRRIEYGSGANPIEYTVHR